MKINYVTGNQGKFKTAEFMLQSFGLELEQKPLDITEIQAETIEEVALDKAKKAFNQVKEPLFISDSGWTILALKGFPGPYMKYINDWFDPEDFLNLMKGKEQRDITLRQVIVFFDENQTKTFTFNSPGKILDKVTGSSGRSTDRIVSLSKSGRSIAEEKEQTVGGFFLEGEEKLWQDFGKWLKEKL